MNMKEWLELSEPYRIVEIIQEIGIEVLGNWDDCCCSNFSLRNVDIEVSCGKGTEQAVRVSSPSMDYRDKTLLKPIMDEVIHQVEKKSNRRPNFKQYFTALDA